MIASEDWSQWSALLDEALELDEGARSAWLERLRAQDLRAADALARLLARGSEAQPSSVLGDSDGYDQALHSALLEDETTQTTDSALPGQSFGPWQVERKLGVGGMGEVWLARRADSLYEAQAAIKLVGTGRDTLRLAGRFARERKLLARLSHPGIARLLDAGVADGQLYLVLEYVEGRLLLDHAHAASATAEARVRLALAIAEAVAYAHSQLVVHRDLKPSNVLVTPDGQVKLLDFGIAGLLDDEDGEATALTQLYGRSLTLDYAAPEQIAGEHTGAAADIFSLAVLLFELLSGQRPFHSASRGRAAREHAVLHQPAAGLMQMLRTPLLADAAAGTRPADLTPINRDLAAVLAKALQKAPEERYQSMAALIDDLERWLQHRPVAAARHGWRQRSRLWLRRNPRVAALAGSLLVSLLVGLSVSLWQWRGARMQAARAQAVSSFMSDLFRAADPEQTKGEKLSARELVDAGSQRLIDDRIDDPEIRAELGAALGATYVSLTRPDKAIPVLEDAVANAIRAYGPQAAQTAGIQLVLAKAEFQNEKYPEADRRWAAAIPLLEAAGEGSSEAVILGRNLWAYALGKQGAFEQADPLIAETLARVRKAYGDVHWLVAETVNDTATLATIRTDWPRARELFESIRPLMLQPPAGHRQDAMSMRLNLANAYARTGEPEQAMGLLPAVVADYTALLGAEANQTLVARWFLADALKRTGQFEACAAEYAALTELRTGISGPRHPLTIDVISKAAMCQRLLGNRERSRVFADRAMVALPESDDPPQRTVLRIISTLAALALDEGDTARGLPLLARMARLIEALKLQTRDDVVWFEVLSAYQSLKQGSEARALQGFEAARLRAPQSMANIAPEAYYAYLLAIAGPADATAAQLTKLRARACQKPPPTMTLCTALDYAEARAGGKPQAQAAALAALRAQNGVEPSLPLSPFWFGLI